MPIRFVDRISRLGRISATLDALTATVVGEVTTPASRTGIIIGQLAPLTASLTGFFTPAISRTGTISATFAPLTATLSGTHTAPAAAWQNVPAITFTQGTAATASFASQIPVGSSSYIIGTAGQTGVPNTSKIAELAARGITLDSANKRLSYDGVGTAGSVSGVILEDVVAQSSDWQSRISGPGVVWYHSFDNAAEVDQFRWTNAFGGGNDPNSGGSGSQYIAQVASGGVDGGGFLRAVYPQGNASGRGDSYWYRPFSAFTGSGNGRGQNDPGANGTITPVAFPASSGSSTTSEWTNGANPGWYMHATHQSEYPGEAQGSDFWVQVRVRRAQTPGAPPDSAQYSYITGKNVWFTTTRYTAVAQELVTYGQSVSNGDVVGVQSRHNVYNGQYFDSLPYQPNATTAVSNLTLNWRYSGGWDTLLYHVTPGTNNGTGSNRTRVEVWAAHQGETSYTKIWDVTYTQGYFVEDTPIKSRPGWNAIICGAYHNGSAFATAFNYDYDQIIFSKQTIPCPQD